MNWNDYVIETRERAIEWFEENYDFFDDLDDAWYYCQLDDTVTGNASGSFYCNRSKAEQAVLGIIFDPEVTERFKMYGYDGIPVERGPEVCDVIARCLALDESYCEIEDMFIDKFEKESEEEDEDSAGDNCKQ